MINDLYHKGLGENPRTAKLMAKLQPGDMQNGSFPKALQATLKPSLPAYVRRLMAATWKGKGVPPMCTMTHQPSQS